jgi:hypothetical protein
MPTRTDILCSIAAALVVAASAYAQDVERFTGKWQGEHQGEVYLVVTIAADLKVTLATGHIHVGETGEIDEANGPAEHAEEVLEARLVEGRLMLRTRQESGEEMRYEMRVEADGTALLRLPDEPDWIKPFRLKKA